VVSTGICVFRKRTAIFPVAAVFQQGQLFFGARCRLPARAAANRVCLPVSGGGDYFAAAAPGFRATGFTFRAERPVFGKSARFLGVAPDVRARRFTFSAKRPISGKSARIPGRAIYFPGATPGFRARQSNFDLWDPEKYF